MNNENTNETINNEKELSTSDNSELLKEVDSLIDVVSDDEYERTAPQISFTRYVTIHLKEQRKKIIKWFKTERGKETDNINDLLTELYMWCAANGSFYTKPQIKIHRYCVSLYHYYEEEYYRQLDDYFRAHPNDDDDDEDFEIDFNRCKRLALERANKEYGVK